MGKTKLYENYPDKVNFGGVDYSLNLSWKNVMRSMDVFSDEKISREIQLETALDNLVIGKHPADASLLDAIFSVIFPENTHKEPVINFDQDADLIFSAFMQAYGVNLKESDMHWCEFSDLLKNIPRNTRLAEVVEIRQRPIPKPTKYNAEERAAIIRAKAQVAIRKDGNLESGLWGIFKNLKALAEAGD